MSSPYAPDTVAVFDALVAYLLAVQYGSWQQLSGQYVYVQPSQQFPNGGVQAGMFKGQVVALLPANSPNIIAEVWGDEDDSKRYSTGGTMQDTQSFHILSFTDNTNGNAAELRLASARDAVQPSFAKSVQLGSTGNVLVARFKPNSGMWTTIERGGRYYRAYIFGISVVKRWTAQGGFVS